MVKILIIMVTKHITHQLFTLFSRMVYTNYCSNICLNSTSTSELVNDFGNIINEYYSLNSPWAMIQIQIVIVQS